MPFLDFSRIYPLRNGIEPYRTWSNRFNIQYAVTKYQYKLLKPFFEAFMAMVRAIRISVNLIKIIIPCIYIIPHSSYFINTFSK